MEVPEDLSGFFIWVKKRYGLANPCADLGLWKRPDNLPRYYTLEEICQILAAVRTDLERALVLLILDNGSPNWGGRQRAQIQASRTTG